MHDTVQAVLRDAAFRRSLQRSLADRLLLWFLDWYERLVKLLRHGPSSRAIVLGVVALIVLFVVVRLVIAASARDEGATHVAHRRGTSSADDPWESADALGAEGRFEDAAHALYRGVILAIGAQERIRLDPSKTSGDYARELRRRGSASLVPFRVFTRRFDVVVYGHGRADAASLVELRDLSMLFRLRARAA
ncbi:MAG: DUF4129 domain-containing protein [bacterium]